MDNNFIEIGNSNVGYTEEVKEETKEQINETLNVEDEVLKAFIGKNADSFFNSKFNWVAAIIGQAVGPVWFFFRKCHLLGWGFVILTFIIGSIASSLEINEASYIMFFIYAFTATPLYLWHVKRKVTKIMNENVGADLETLKQIASKKGGTSVLAVVIYGIVFFVFFALIIGLIALSFYYMY